ncbi:MAG: 30S ribosomal protein S5 [Candidatus Aenigmatarchaeota archaeon]
MVDEEEITKDEPFIPKTKLGKNVAEAKIASIDEIFRQGEKIKEAGIVDKLLSLKSEIVWIGGSPGKGGGIRRTPTKRTSKMHGSGRRYKVSALVIVGNEDGYLGIGKGSANNHKAAIEKATEKAKLNLIPVKRGCGSWECGCGEPHSIAHQTEGKMGSVRVVLKPAPRGLGLCCSNEMKKIMTMAGIKDIRSKSYGQRKTRTNIIFATFNAFKNLNKIKV